MTDRYDTEHQDTGSGNISHATPEWREILEQARSEHQGEGYILHFAYELVNQQVADGIPWNKCPNCGSPYRLDSEGANDTLCSQECTDAYRDYIMGERFL